MTNISGVQSLALEIEDRLRTLPRISAGTVRRLRKEYSARLATAPSFVIRELAALLLFQPGLKFRLFAFELLGDHESALFSIRPVDLAQLGATIDSRSAADTFAMSIVSPLWQARRIPDEILQEWAQSESPWWKRVATVSTISSLRCGTKSPALDARTLRIVKQAIAGRDNDVVTGLVSALRPLLRGNFDAARGLLESLEVANHPALRRLQRRREAKHRRNRATITELVLANLA